MMQAMTWATRQANQTSREAAGVDAPVSYAKPAERLAPRTRRPPSAGSFTFTPIGFSPREAVSRATRLPPVSVMTADGAVTASSRLGPQATLSPGATSPVGGTPTAGHSRTGLVVMDDARTHGWTHGGVTRGCTVFSSAGEGLWRPNQTGRRSPRGLSNPRPLSR